MKVDIGFTGTRRGMTSRQKKTLRDLLCSLLPSFPSVLSFEHGGAVGADTDAHKIAEGIGRETVDHPIEIFVRPAFGSKFKAYETNVFSEKPPLERNREIVSDAEILIAAPKSLKEELRSGTWATIRYAREQNVPIIILDP